MVEPARTNADSDLSGREAEVSRLLKALEESRQLDASPIVSLLWGPAGVGKTFVLSAFEREAQARGARVFRGSAPRNDVRSYSLFSDLLPAVLDELSSIGVSDKLVGDLASRTIPLAGRSSSHGQRTLLAPADRKLDLIEAVSQALVCLGNQQPPVIVLDDIDAADGASLGLLRYLISLMTAPPSLSDSSQGVGRSLWVLSFRDTKPLNPILEEIVSNTPAITVPLDGLDHAGLRAFLSRPCMVDRVLDSTGGIPERIETLLSVGSPDDVSALVGRKIEALCSGAKRAVIILAAMGGALSPGRVEALLNLWTGDSLGDALDQLVASRIAALRQGGGGSLLYLAQKAEGDRLLQSLPEDERHSLHGLLGDLLAREGADPVEVSRHYCLAGSKDRAFEWTVKAGEALLSRLAYGEAVETFGLALNMLDQVDECRAVELYEVLQDLHFGLSDHKEALRWLGRLKKAYRRDPARLRQVKARIARACLALGRVRLTDRIAREILGISKNASSTEVLEKLDVADVVTAGVFADLLEARRVLHNDGDAIELAAAALVHYGEVDDNVDSLVFERLSIRNTLGKLYIDRREFDHAEAQFLANVAESETLGLARECARAMNNIGVVAHRVRQRDKALEYYRRSLAHSCECGDRAKEAFALQNLAVLCHEVGEFVSALEYYQKAIAAFTLSQNTTQLSRAASNLALLYRFFGDFDTAYELCAYSKRLADNIGDPYLKGYATVVRGDILLAQDRLFEAKEAYAQAKNHLQSIDSPRLSKEISLHLAWLACREGDLDQSRALLSVVSEVLEDKNAPSLAPYYLLTSAEVYLAAGELERAQESLVFAREYLLDSPNLESPVIMYHLMSKVSRRLLDHKAADDSLARAQRVLDELVARIPDSYKDKFLAQSKWREVFEPQDEYEITPTRLRRDLALDSDKIERRSALRSEVPKFEGIIGKNIKLTKVLSLMKRVASVSQPVLIRGPSGTGKELIADAIHQSGPRATRPFIKVNCAAMHDELLLSELFGHEKGSFSGAHQMRKGRFELADGGTLFLDEIGDISPKVQVALLRVIQQQSFERVGGNKTIRVDARVVCATNKNLEEMIQTGEFREDLYYRLKGVMLEMPSLSERIDDLPELVEHFLQKISQERGEPQLRVSSEVMAAFSRYTWPGNIRELEQVIQSVSLFAGGDCIDMVDLESHPSILNAGKVSGDLSETVLRESIDLSELSGCNEHQVDLFDLAKSSGLSLKEFKREVEETCIKRALEEAEGNISEAARLLGMKRSRLSQIVNADDNLKGLAAGR